MAQTETVKFNLFEAFIEFISTPLGFFVSLGILILVILGVLYMIKNWNAINDKIAKAQFEVSEQLAMFSKEEWRKRNVYIGILSPLIIGLGVSLLSLIFLRPVFKIYSLISAIIFSILSISGGLIYGRKYIDLYRTSKKRYSAYLSEKEKIMSILGKEFAPLVHLPEIDSIFEEIGFSNGQGIKILKLLSGKIKCSQITCRNHDGQSSIELDERELVREDGIVEKPF